MFPVGVGASGAVFGIAGALIVLLKTTRLPVPPVELKKLRRSVIYFAVINLVIGLSINVGTAHFGSGIAMDNFAHLGGCASGLLLAVPMVPRIGSPRESFVCCGGAWPWACSQGYWCCSRTTYRRWLPCLRGEDGFHSRVDR